MVLKQEENKKTLCITNGGLPHQLTTNETIRDNDKMKIQQL